MTCRALVPVDGTRIRKKALSNCRRARTTFAKAERDLERYETEIVPAYERWRRETFGPILQEISQLHERIREMDTKVAMLEDIMDRMGCGPAEAMDILEKEGDEPDPEDGKEDASSREALEEMEDFMCEMEEALASMLHANKPHIEEALAQGVPRVHLYLKFMNDFITSSNMTETESLVFVQRKRVHRLMEEADLLPREEEYESEEKPDDGDLSKSNTRVRVKKLMREMAFALHPDRCGGHDEEKIALWHRVQVAAEAEDLDELEVLHAHMQLITGDIGPGVSVARLIDLTQTFRQSRAAIRRQLTRHRDKPPWIFKSGNPRDHDYLKRKLNEDYRDTLRLCREALDFMKRKWRRYERVRHSGR